MSTSYPLTRSGSAGSTIVQAGLLAGALDISAACIQAYLVGGVTPAQVLRYVASGVWGPDAFQGGTGMALQGLLFHFIIAFGWATLFFFAYPLIRKVSTNWVLNGLVYGVIVWTLMNRVIVPLSNVPARPFQFNVQAMIGMAIIMGCIGLPIAWIVQKYYNKSVVKS